MSDKQSPTIGGSDGIITADEFQEISYYAWRRGFAGPKTAPAQTDPVSPPTPKGARLFKF